MFSVREHPDDRALVSRLDHELSAAEARAIDAHLATCERCRARADDLLAAEMSVRIALRAESDADHHARNRARLSHSLDREQERWRPSRLRVRQVLAPVAVAAMVAGMAITLAYVSRDDPAGRGDASALPIASLTPGAAASLTATQLCSGTQPARAVPAAVARRVLHAYAMEDLSPDQYELDALITPELGGTVVAENLWPQRYSGSVWTAYVKDEIENHLRDLVCDGTLDLATAQRDMATNWIAAYKKYLHRDLPVPDHRSLDAVPEAMIAATPRDLIRAAPRVQMAGYRVAIE